VTLAGTIRIDLFHRFGNATGVQIVSSRPDAVAKVLIGKTLEQVLDTVPLLFSLCGNAQSYAALSACRAALGMEAEPDADSARDLLVQVETLREHAWRILLDWPVFVGLVPDKNALAALLKFDALFKKQLFRHGEAFKLDSCFDIDAERLTRLIDELEALIDASIFNGRLTDFQALISEAQLYDWLQKNETLPGNLLNYLYSRNWMIVGQNNVECLPELDTEALNRQMMWENLSIFTKIPRWQGYCFESTLLNRQLLQPLIAELYSRYGNGLIVRILGRLMEVALISTQLRQPSKSIKTNVAIPVQSVSSDGIGLAQIQAARGLLIHRLELRKERVYDYHIVAPTEWNFHPEGVVTQGLKQLRAESPSDLKRQAELFINAVDPCVQYTLHLTPQR
jgi:hypothetical protein